MAVNQKFDYDGYVPILHICRHLDEYFCQFEENEKLEKKKGLAIGGIVPNLLRASKAMSYEKILDGVFQVREKFANKKLHLFGVGRNLNITRRGIVRNGFSRFCRLAHSCRTGTCAVTGYW